jgi:quercetin dioxygenase-like cupin family protein
VSSSAGIAAWVKRPLGRVVVIWGAAAVFAAGAGAAALATPASGTITRTDLAKGTVSDTIDFQTHTPSDFYLQSLVIDPGASSGWHTHPGAEYTIVKSGTVTLVTASCTPRVLGAGQAFFIPPNTSHFARNDGTAPVELYVTYTVPTGAGVRNDAFQPCP